MDERMITKSTLKIELLGCKIYQWNSAIHLESISLSAKAQSCNLKTKGREVDDN